MSNRQHPNERDRKVLEIVATAKWITHRQLAEIAKITGLEKNDNRKVFEWRVRRLSDLGLLKKQRPALLDREILYSITKNGILRLETMGVHPLSLAFDRDEPETTHHIPHSLEMNRIRIALLRACTVARWLPDSAIRVLRKAGDQDYAKVYDAVATLVISSEVYRIGIEYERSLKAIERYQEIASKLADERGVQAVLYLCPNHETLTTISHVFFRATKTVIVAMMEDFVANPLDGRAQVNVLTTSLRTELQRISQQTTSTQQRALVG